MPVISAGNRRRGRLIGCVHSIAVYVGGCELGIVEAVDPGAGDRHGRFGKGVDQRTSIPARLRLLSV